MTISSKNRLFSSILVVAAVLFSALVAELGLRFSDFSYYWPQVRYPDPVTGWAIPPGISGWQRLEGEAFVRINGDGWRDRPQPLQVKKGRFRIAVLGDSFTEAVQVPLGKTYWRILEDILPECRSVENRKEIEILGLGASGYSTAQELLVLEERVWKYSPDLVILAFFTGNDILENSSALDGDEMRPYYVFKDGKLVLNSDFQESEEYRDKNGLLGRVGMFLVQKSRLLQALGLAGYRIEAARKMAASKDDPPAMEPGVDPRLYQPPQDDEWRSAWAVTEAIIQRMHKNVLEHQARFLLVTLSNGAQVHPDPEFRRRFAEKLAVPNLFYAEERLRRFGLAMGFPVLNMAPDFQRFADKTGIWLHGFPNTMPGVGHWNEDGHRLAAQRIASFLCHNEYMFEKL